MTAKPEIIHVIPTIGRGGAERIALELCLRLPSHGFRTRIVTLFGAGSLWEEVRRLDIRYSQMLEDHAGSRIELMRNLTLKFFGEFERRPDLIHTHLFGADFWTQAVSKLHMFLHSKEKTIPIIATAHNIDHDDSSLRRALRAWANRRMDHVAAISEDVKRYVAEDLRVSPKRISVIPNGIETAGIVMRAREPFHETPRFIVVGRIETQKGHGILLRALKHVPPPWQLSIVGTGSKERDIKELAEELGLASRIYFLGDRSDVRDLLAESDLFLFPSQWEGMGLALLEAMAAQVPVLASDLPSLRDFVPKDRLVDRDNVTAWSEAIRKSLMDDQSIIKQAEKQGSQIIENYPVDRMVERYAKLYRNLLKKA